MSDVVRRGFLEKDVKEFQGDSHHTLYKAGEELHYLLDRGYSMKGATTFIGNHYLLSERQRLALMRSISSSDDLALRAQKKVTWTDLADKEVSIDTFNTIITLEVALSDAMLLRCMDSTIRDLAGLRGTYRIIRQTEIALSFLFTHLAMARIRKATFYIDAPVSNSGRLKELILSIASQYSFSCEAIVLNEVDQTLEKLPYVITSDAIILNRCTSWYNLNASILSKMLPNAWIISLYELS